MKVLANNIRPGHVVDHNNKLWVVTKIQHTQPGKGGAYMQIEWKNAVTGTKSNERFNSGEKIEKVHLDQKEMTYLYNDGENYIFMDQETFDQHPISPSVMGEQEVFLQENMICTLQMFDDKPLSVELPETVTLEIVEADPVIKGQTVSSSYKPAVLSNGVKVMVPPFIGVGTMVVVRTADGEYMERAKG